MYSLDQEKKLNILSSALLKDNALTKDHLEELRDVLRYHEWKYYVNSNPTIADFEYDQLYKKLEFLEATNLSLVTPDSPTQRVGSDLKNTGNSVDHIQPMLSLANSYNEEDLVEFDLQIKRFLKIDEAEDIAYTVEPKYDGGSVAFVYKNDLLVQAATRGNGIQGEEMTANAKTLPSIPLSAKFSDHGFATVELRGEAVIRKDRFDALNDKRLEEGLPLLANPRNSAAGGLRTKDPMETRNREIEVFVFQFGYGADSNKEPNLTSLDSHYNGIQLLDKLGFKVPTEEIKLCKNIREAVKYCEAGESGRDRYPYEIDGMVVKLNSLELQQRSGETAHHPRWAIAYKFKAKQATTILEDVEYQVGKIGSITPVAKVKPVALAGVTISSISLHNEEFIVSRDLKIGDQILIERAGDVIPYIVKSFPELRNNVQDIVFPSHCPSCQTALVKEASEAAWRCPNYHCEDQILQRMAFHVSKDAMNIDGFGKSLVERFYKLGMIKDIADIYNLNYDEIASLDGLGQKSADNLKAAIEVAKQNPIQRVFYSLSIHHFGRKASKLIAEQVAHVMDLKNWKTEDFVDIKDIGPVVAENVVEFFSDPTNIALLERMKSYGVNMEQTEDDKPLVVDKDAPLINKSILFTGTLQQLGRKEAQELAVKSGARNISAVSSKLDILVVGEKAGSKLKKAQALGTVQILSEQEFIDLVSS